MKKKLRLVAIVSLAGIGVGFWASAAATPPPGFNLPEQVTAGDLSGVPDLIPVLDHSGNVAGYARKEDVFAPPPGPPGEAGRSAGLGDPGIPVYDESGSVQVGFLDEEGFRPL